MCSNVRETRVKWQCNENSNHLLPMNFTKHGNNVWKWKLFSLMIVLQQLPTARRERQWRMSLHLICCTIYLTQGNIINAFVVYWLTTNEMWNKSRLVGFLQCTLFQRNHLRIWQLDTNIISRKYIINALIESCDSYTKYQTKALCME